jgi:hypothetical protein
MEAGIGGSGGSRRSSRVVVGGSLVLGRQFVTGLIDCCALGSNFEVGKVLRSLFKSAKDVDRQSCSHTGLMAQTICDLSQESLAPQ